VPWPTCEEGYNLRKLTLFASQVVSDFKNIPLPPGGGPRKVVELAQDYPEITLEDLDLASWRHCVVYFLGVPGLFSLAKTYFNGDMNEDNYYGQLLLALRSSVYVLTGQGTIGPPPGDDAAQWICHILFSGGRIRMWAQGDNNVPTSLCLGSFLLVYAPTVENLTSITFYSGDPNNPYKAGTRVEVW
jgi:hypothetical protein